MRTKLFGLVALVLAMRLFAKLASSSASSDDAEGRRGTSPPPTLDGPANLDISH